MNVLDEIIIRSAGTDPHSGSLQTAELSMRCALGGTGISLEKREGDGATPAGRYPFRRCFFRGDRIARPDTVLPITQIGALDGWSDDPMDPDYNCFVRFPEDGPRDYSAERLWRDDRIYDLIVVIGHNDDPPVPGAGSAIFMHLARPDFSATEGCVALCLKDLLSVVARIGPETIIDIRD
ncbi:MAG: L,D-transpeptidase family protein [Pseudomonadota bacterium]